MLKNKHYVLRSKNWICPIFLGKHFIKKLMQNDLLSTSVFNTTVVSYSSPEFLHISETKQQIASLIFTILQEWGISRQIQGRNNLWKLLECQNLKRSYKRQVHIHPLLKCRKWLFLWKISLQKYHKLELLWRCHSCMIYNKENKTCLKMWSLVLHVTLVPYSYRLIPFEKDSLYFNKGLFLELSDLHISFLIHLVTISLPVWLWVIHV